MIIEPYLPNLNFLAITLRDMNPGNRRADTGESVLIPANLIIAFDNPCP